MSITALNPTPAFDFRELTPSARMTLEIHTLFEKLGKEEQASFAENLERHYEELTKIQKERIHTLDVSVQQQSTSWFWRTVESVASFFSGALALITGASMISATPSVAGAALVLSGGATLINTLFKESEKWEWLVDKFSQGDNEQIKKKLRVVIPLALSALSIALSASSASQIRAALNSNPITLLTNFATGVDALTLLTGFISTATGIGGAVNETRAQFTDAELTRLAGLIQEIQQEIEGALKQSESESKQNQAIMSELAYAIQTQSQMIRV